MRTNSLEDLCVFSGGMAVNVSSPEMARKVAIAGKGKTAGITSGTLAGHIAAVMLADGDPNYLRSLDAFSEMAPDVAAFLRKKAVWNSKNKIPIPMWTDVSRPFPTLLNIFGGFAVTWLACEGHDYPVGVNLLEKVQYPHMEVMFGVMLAMTTRRPGTTTFIIAGAGKPTQFPSVLCSLAYERRATYRADCVVRNASGEERYGTRELLFDLEWMDTKFPVTARRFKSLLLQPPPVIAIVGGAAMAKRFQKITKNGFAGLEFEDDVAGGHVYFDKKGRDPRVTEMCELGVPVWLAGDWGSPDRLQEALDLGANGVQVGSLFALSDDSGFLDWIKREAIAQIRAGTLEIELDFQGSPTGFPWNRVALPGTTGVQEVAAQHKASCELGYLRTDIVDESGKTLDRRCAAEPPQDFLKKGGDPKYLEGVLCLCRQLFAAAGFKNPISGVFDLPTVTLGRHAPQQVREFLRWNGDKPYTAPRVVEYLLSGTV